MFFFFVWYVEIEEGEKDWGFFVEIVMGIYYDEIKYNLI